MRLNGRIEIKATVLSPIHHGAGVSGNVALLRTQEVVQDGGSLTRVPYVSGNSLKHMIRDGAVRFALDAMGVKDGTLSKPVVDLLFSGGHLSKGGSAVDLESSRRISEIFPVLSLCGYSAGNVMVGSKLRVDNLHLVCLENKWRAPEWANELAVSEKRSGHFRSREFGTRHEATRIPHVARHLLPEEVKRLDDLYSTRARRKAEALEKGETALAEVRAEGSSQMLFEFEVIKPGSLMWGGIQFEDLTAGESMAFRTGLGYSCEGIHSDGGFIYRIGARGSVGYGRVSMTFQGALKSVEGIPSYSGTDEMLPAVTDSEESDMKTYVDSLRDHKGEIFSILDKLF